MREYKLFAQRIILVGLTRFVNNFKGVILLPVLTKNLPIQDYGIWAQVMVTIGIVPGIMSLGLPGAMARFMPSVKVKEKFQDMFYSFLSVAAVTGMFAAFLIYLASGPIADLLFDGNAFIVKLLSIVVFFETIEKVLFNYFRATEQIKKDSILRFSKNFLMVVLVSIFVLQGGGLLGAIAGLLAKSVVVFLMAFVIIVSQLGFKLPKFGGLKGYLKYGIPLVPSRMSSWIVRSSDRYVIGGYLGTSAVGYYSPGYTLGNIVQMFVAPLNFILPMVLSRHYDGDNLDEVKKYLGYSLKYFLAVAIPAVFGLSLLSKPMLVILSTPEIAEQSYIITPFVALSALLFGVFAVFNKVAMLVKKTQVIGIIWLIAAVLNLGLNLILVPYIGIIAAATTTLLSFIVVLAFMAYYSLRFFQFDMNFRFIVKSLVASLLMSGIILMWSPTGVLSTLAIIGVCAVSYFAVLVLLKGFRREEIEFFKSFIR
ncbi:polysaccharide biosynthesis protein [Methanohalobium evestigatum Z-7303]|uniref:Polysaccharide biosynthesis protein n=1 Tax=Methanohalobium evestigatum (strain ATCC BAA-1072 / DSM 3721 / NBRC 107634 / OCM 161 / Z-7303) TaxID=644295 RepID=D7E7N4_METEZ|nr:oligosaccharide flippase family protein [Methanohalobium evestigatum]ADI74107.1 polysaccharide biosynthesis protein [Methanohalobium evestigatum Z-7303]